MQKSRNQRIKEALLAISDRIDLRCHVSGELVPPKSLSSQYGGGPFAEVGLEFFRYLLDLAGLTRTSHVLDVGCGAGRIALPLTAYLTAEGRYEGFDIMAAGIDYCSRVWTPRLGNFRFRRADIFNSYYNPAGRTQPEQYRFDHPDATFDVVLSTSVFTHLRPPAIQHYIDESHRVLRPGGYALHTCFLLNAESTSMIAAGSDRYRFQYKVDDFMTNDPVHVESAIAVDEEQMRSFYQRSGFGPLAVHYGSWPGRTSGFLSVQDVCVARKP